MNITKGPARFIWIPRILTVIFILFLLLFSFDVFELEGSLVEKMGGFIIHSVPSIIMAVILALNWNKPLRCGLIFLILGILFALLFKTYREIATLIVITLPLIISGVLFLLAHKLHKEA